MIQLTDFESRKSSNDRENCEKKKKQTFTFFFVLFMCNFTLRLELLFADEIKWKKINKIKSILSLS